MKKKTLSAILCGAMAVSLMAGCGSSASSSSAEAASSAASSASSAASESASEESTSSSAAEESSSSEAVEASSETASTSASGDSDNVVVEAVKNDGQFDGETLSILVSAGWMDNRYDATIQRFEDEYGVTVDLQTIPADQYSDVLQSDLSNGQCPDIFWIQSNPFAIESQIVDPENYCIDFTGADWQNVMPETRQSSCIYNDKLYGLQIWHNSPEYVMVYNKTLFKELGIDQVPTTYDDLKADCKTIADAGITPWFMPGADGWQHQLAFFQIGGVYEEAYLVPGARIPENLDHEKVVIEGLVRNVTYRLDEIVDCPMEFILPEIEDDTHGAWFEIRCRHAGAYSMTLVPPEGVKIATEHTQKETAGVNMINLHYTDVDGVKIWRFMNTHSGIPA